jgi:predicted RNA-binding protein YlxR (DUF448 family)
VRSQEVLRRVARRPDGELVVDRTAPGRGAWLCAETWDACIDEGLRRRAFPRAFKAAVTDEAVQRLRHYPH